MLLVRRVCSEQLLDSSGWLLLYRELYFRHLYSRLTPSLQQRIDSWANYEALFSLLLDGDGPADLVS